MHKASNNDEFSRSLVSGRLIHDKINGYGSDYFMLGYYYPRSSNDLKDVIHEDEVSSIGEDIIENKYIYKAYEHQIGLHGIVFSSINYILPFNLQTNINILKFFNVLLSIIFIVYILFWFSSIIGSFWMLPVTVGILPFYAQYFFIYTTNLYWVPWTCFLPMLAAIYLTLKNYSWKGWIVYFLSVAFRCGCGFEFLSTILIASSVPVIYDLYQKKYNVRDTLRQIVNLFFVAVTAFFTTLFISVYILGLKYGSITEGALEYIINISRRTSGFGDLSGQKDIILQSVNSSVFTVVYGYLHSNNLVLVILLAIVAVSYFDLKRKYKYKNEGIEIGIFSSLLCLIATFSWVIMAKGHSYIHFELIQIIWDLPFTSISIATLFYTWITLGRKYLSIGINSRYYIFCISTVIGFLIAVLSYTHFFIEN